MRRAGTVLEPMPGPPGRRRGSRSRGRRPPGRRPARRSPPRPPGTAPRGQAHAAEGDDGQAADGQARDRADAHLLHEQQHHVAEAVAGLADPVDEAQHEQDGDGVVEAGLALQRAGQPLLERRAAEDREDRGAVGAGDDRPDEHALQQREVEQPRGQQPADDRAQDRAEHGEGQRRAQDGPDLRPARGQAALEQDQRQRDDAHAAGQLVVAEVDPPDAVGPDRHPDPQEQQQARDPHPPGQQGRGQARGQQGAGDEQELAVGHPPPVRPARIHAASSGSTTRCPLTVGASTISPRSSRPCTAARTAPPRDPPSARAAAAP